MLKDDLFVALYLILSAALNMDDIAKKLQTDVQSSRPL